MHRKRSSGNAPAINLSVCRHRGGWKSDHYLILSQLIHLFNISMQWKLLCSDRFHFGPTVRSRFHWKCLKRPAVGACVKQILDTFRKCSKIESIDNRFFTYSAFPFSSIGLLFVRGALGEGVVSKVLADGNSTPSYCKIPPSHQYIKDNLLGGPIL